MTTLSPTQLTVLVRLATPGEYLTQRPFHGCGVPWHYNSHSAPYVQVRNATVRRLIADGYLISTTPYLAEITGLGLEEVKA